MGVEFLAKARLRVIDGDTGTTISTSGNSPHNLHQQITRWSFSYNASSNGPTKMSLVSCSSSMTL